MIVFSQCGTNRRAVIICDIIGMIGAALSLVSLAIPIENRFVSQEEVDDDAVLDEINTMYLVDSIVTGVGLLAFAVPVYGALQYNVPMIGYGIVWLVATFIASIVIGVVYTPKINDARREGEDDISVPIGTFVGGAIFTALYIYPHVGLMNEINQGIMSHETYPREDYSCCCGPAGRP